MYGIRRPLFDSYAQLQAYAATLPAGTNPALIQYLAGSMGDDGSIVQVFGGATPLSPPATVNGGYSVVAVVNSTTQVTLAAAGPVSGRIRIWDFSAGAHLDAGGVNCRVSGATVHMASTAGIAPGDVIYNDRAEYHNFEAVSGFLTAVGNGFDGDSPLLNLTTKRTIARWGWVGGVIVPLGPIDFTKVTPTRWGRAQAAAGTTITIAAGYSWAPTATPRTMRVLNITDGAEGGDYEYTLVGDQLTTTAAAVAAVAALLAGGKTVELQDTAVELSVGGATRAIQLGAGGFCRHTATGLVWPTQTADSVIRVVPQWIQYTAKIPAAELGAAQFDLVGIGTPGAVYHYYGFSRRADATVGAATIRATTNVFTAAGVAYAGGACALEFTRRWNAVGQWDQLSTSVQTVAVVGGAVGPLGLRLVASGVIIASVQSAL